MRSLAIAFETNADQLRTELELYNVLRTALESKYANDGAELRQYVQRARRMSYSNAIIGLYGLLEQTVDAILVAVAEGYQAAFATHGDLPERVKSEYRQLVLKYLQDQERGRFRGRYDENSGVTALVKRSSEPVNLLAIVFTTSSANYRAPYVKSLFERLNVNVDIGLNVATPTDALDATGFANYDSFLEDLVQRRNEIAHSYGDENTLNPDLIRSYADITFAYIARLERIANRVLLELILQRKSSPIGTIVKSWTGRVGVRLVRGEIKVGDRLLIIKDDWCTSHEVKSLQSDDVSQNFFRYEGEDLDVAAQIGVVPSAADNASVYVLTDDLSEYWPHGDK